MGTEEMAQWIRGFVYIFSPHRKLSLAVCVSVTSVLWEAEAGGFLRFAAHEFSSRASQSLCRWDKVGNGRAGHWTCVLSGCLLHPHTHTYVYKTQTHIHRHLHTEMSNECFPACSPVGRPL